MIPPHARRGAEPRIQAAAASIVAAPPPLPAVAQRPAVEAPETPPPDPPAQSSTVSEDDGTRRYHIVLGDTCAVCRAFSQISFAPDRPPQLPLMGCREPSGCRCSLPSFSPYSSDSQNAVTIPEPAPPASMASLASDETPATPSGPEVVTPALLHDAATGVFSPEALLAFGELLAATAMRREMSLSVFLVTLDGAEQVSSEAGPGATDARVRALADSLRRTVRSSDMVGRYGSDGFALIAEGAGQDGALQLAERIRAALAELPPMGSPPRMLTVSQGIASLPQSGFEMSALLQQAEAALDAAIAEGGNRVRAAGPIDEPSESDLAPPPRTTAADRLILQRRADLTQLTQAYASGQIEGIAITTHPGACPVCRDAARDVYVPRSLPPLPIAGCSGLDGCRCVYSAPRPDPRRRPPPIPAESRPDLDIPRRLHDAALFGSDPKRNCKPEVLAEYLDAFPLLPFQVDIHLQAGEAAYLTRPARRSWEWVTPESAAIRGPTFPFGEPFSLWIRQAIKPPTLPSQATPFWDTGLFCLTNWRILFRRRDSVDSVLLADVTGVEYLKNGFACTIGSRDKRLIFVLDNPLQVGLCLTRAIRDSV